MQRSGDPLFRPEFFAHGRLLYRFPGSDACRFSPRLAYSLVRQIALDSAGQPAVLWDPFCGAGLIVSIARLFFPQAFVGIAASDIAPDAVACCKKNLLLVSMTQAAKKRLKQIHGLRKMNAKSDKRWGAVAAYLEGLIPRIQSNEGLGLDVHTMVASVFQLPLWIEGRVHFIGDLPYGRSSHMAGEEGMDRLIDTIATAYPTSTMTFIMPRAMVGQVIGQTGHRCIETRPCRYGRAVVRIKPGNL